ncbi:hydroxycarboxylic acid receptor 3-like [Genypterus blacodes]|uniref:hydroxycarboxylic acid receptor 3-like n=1 Tax=Genypterus blacodes TaxID=154954 RepID=UPI003F765200
MQNLTSIVPNNTTAGGGCPPVGIQLEGRILPPVLAIDVLLGLLGNFVALWIFCLRLKSWNPINQFLFNLVIADFLVLISLPLRIDALLRGHWVFGDGMCRINLFLMFSNRSASIALMTVVALYRYFRVVHPQHRFNRMTKRQARYVSVFVWLLVIAPRIPMLAYSHIKHIGTTTQCFFFTSYKEASQAIRVLLNVHRILTVFEFIIPLVVLLFCSVRVFRVLRKWQTGNPKKFRKEMWVCAAIVGVFVLCFLPTTITSIGLWVIASFRPSDCASFYTFTQLTIVSLGLNFLNSALDPIIYFFTSSMFRKVFCSVLPAALRCGEAAVEEGETAASSSGIKSTTHLELRSMMDNRGRDALEQAQML